MSTRFISALFLFLCSACGASNYALNAPAMGEIYWTYDSGLVAHQEGQAISSSGTWGGLEERVGCVPDAKTFADGVHTEKVAGRIATWTGLIAIPTGAAAGAYLLLQDDAPVAPGLITLGAGVVGGLLTAVIGAALEGDATVDAIDAVNAYNDQRETIAACRL